MNFIEGLLIPSTVTSVQARQKMKPKRKLKAVRRATEEKSFVKVLS